MTVCHIHSRESRSWGSQWGNRRTSGSFSRKRQTNTALSSNASPAVEDPQEVWLLLLMCASTRANFWLRGVQPDWTSIFAATPTMHTCGNFSDRFSGTSRSHCLVASGVTILGQTNFGHHGPTPILANSQNLNQLWPKPSLANTILVFEVGWGGRFEREGGPKGGAPKGVGSPSSPAPPISYDITESSHGGST